MQGRKQGDRHHLGLCRQPASPLLSCPLLLQLQPTPQAPPLLLPPPPPTRSMSQSPRTVKLCLTLQVRPLTHPLIMLITNSARLCPPPPPQAAFCSDASMSFPAPRWFAHAQAGFACWPISTKAKTVSVISSSLFSLQHWPQGLTVLETALDSLELV